MPQHQPSVFSNNDQVTNYNDSMIISIIEESAIFQLEVGKTIHARSSIDFYQSLEFSADLMLKTTINGEIHNYRKPYLSSL